MIFSKYLNYALGVLIVLSVVATVHYRFAYMKGKNDVLVAQQARDTAQAETETQKKANKSLQDQLDAITAANKVHQDELERLRKEKEKSDNALKNALKNNRDWADSAIPDSVWNALQD